MVFKPEGGELSPWQRARLDREYVQIGQIAAETEVKRELVRAGIRERDANREADHRDRDERRTSELETERLERIDHRIERYALLVFFLITTVATVFLAFLAFDSSEDAVKITPSVPAVVAIATVLRLRTLTGSSRTSIWDWLIRREKK